MNDPLDGENKGNQDALQDTGQPSDPETGPSTTAKVYSEAEVEELVKQRHSKLDKRIAELEKQGSELESARQRAKEAEDRAAQVQKQIEARELEGIKDDPELVKLYQRRKELDDKAKTLDARERELSRKELQIKTESEAIAKTLRQSTISGIATKYGVEVKVLEELGIDDADRLEKVAKIIGKPKAQPETVKPDSGLSVGGGHPTNEQLDKMSMADYAKWRKSQEQ